MSTFNNARQNHSKLTTFILFVVALFLVLGILIVFAVTAGSVEGAKREKGCTGTYFIEFANDSAGLWTMSQDGTFQGADSAEDAFGFSHLQGAWTADNDGVATLVALNFTIDNQVPPSTMVRVDATLTYDATCSEVDVIYDVRRYDVANSEDPLVPGGGTLLGANLLANGHEVAVN